MSSSTVPQVQYRQLGKSGLRVSVPIIGAMSFGSSQWAKWVLDEDETFKILDAAWDRGINTIDTANLYSNGESERLIGKWIKQNNIPRQSVIVATKCYALVSPNLSEHPLLRPELNDHRDYVNQGGLSRAAIFNAVEASLARLDLTYIDLFQIHRFDPNTPVEETMKALHDLVQSGKVRYIGASSMWAWQFAGMNEVAGKHGWTKFVCMQNEYSLLYREEEREMNAYCNYNGIGIIPYAPLSVGALARPLDTNSLRSDLIKGSPFDRVITPADEIIIGRVEEIAKKKGIQMSQVALAWATTKVSSPIVGINSVQRLEEALIAGITLNAEEIKYLEEPYQPKPIRGHA